MESVRVELGDRSYEIIINEGVLSNSGHIISALPIQKKIAVITNSTIAPLYLSALRASLENASFEVSEIIIPDGEEHKNLAQMEKIYNALLALNSDRNSPVIALGGGVVGDMTGFAAATFLRGVPFIQIPTTLLSQVDSSVGGKTGVNLPGGKNMVGAFYQPRIVIIDPEVLTTLPERELMAGMAEIIKYAVIRDKNFFSYLYENVDSALHLHLSTISNIIKTCCAIKADITTKDETEKGIRTSLNFGHTIGHAIETLTHYREYTHGEAVAIGMAAAAKLSSFLGYSSDAEYQQVKALITMYGLPTQLPLFSLDEYITSMLKDKKKTGDSIQMVLMQEIGNVVLEKISIAKLQRAFKNAFNLG
ncbi:MAG: 3-dehydroquinate synthase [Pseudomonadota bacterium]